MNLPGWTPESLARGRTPPSSLPIPSPDRNPSVNRKVSFPDHSRYLIVIYTPSPSIDDSVWFGARGPEIWEEHSVFEREPEPEPWDEVFPVARSPGQGSMPYIVSSVPKPKPKPSPKKRDMEGKFPDPPPFLVTI